jgi:hypothetical protein
MIAASAVLEEIRETKEVLVVFPPQKNTSHHACETHAFVKPPQEHQRDGCHVVFNRPLTCGLVSANRKKPYKDPDYGNESL